MKIANHYQTVDNQRLMGAVPIFSAINRRLSILLIGLVLICQMSRPDPGYGYTLLKSTDAVVRMKAAQEIGNKRIKEAIPDLIEALKDESSGVRISAVVSLGYFKDERIIEPLIEILKKDKNRAVKIMTIQSLGRFRDKKVVKILDEMVEDKDSRVRSAACRSLGMIGNEKVVKKLLQRLEKDENWLVRQVTVNALTDLIEMRNVSKKDRESIEKAIKNAEEDKNEKVKKSAKKALKRLEKILRKKK